MMRDEAFSVTLRDGAEIRGREIGRRDSPPLCLVAGLGGTGAFWDRVVPALSRDFRVVLHDHRGTGESSASRIDYSIRQMADDLLQVMDARGVGPALVAGHSTGGAIAQCLALDHAPRVRGLVFSSTWAGPDPYFTALFQLRSGVLRSLGAAAYLRLGALLLHPPQALAADPVQLQLSEDAAAAQLRDPDIVASRIRALLAHDRRADLPGLVQPALVVCARDDRVTPPHMSDELASLVPGARLALIDDGGHFAPRTRPEAWLAEVVPHLSRAAA